ncbi:hypothetical protein, partial [Escherichia coli]
MNRTSPYYCRRSVLSLLISALIYAPPGMTAFTPDVIGVVNDETVDGSQRVDERGTTNNTHIINHWICPYISRHLLSLNPLLACCRRYSR